MKSSDLPTTIRPLDLADAAAYREFRLRGLYEHPDAFTSSAADEGLKPLEYTEKRLSSGSETLWGAFSDGALVGMVGLSRETREKNRHKATLVGMYVAPELAGRGIGTNLIETVIRHARKAGIELIVLTVTEGNRGAIGLYAKSGFVPFGIEPDAVRVNHISYGKQHMFLQLAPS